MADASIMLRPGRRWDDPEEWRRMTIRERLIKRQETRRYFRYQLSPLFHILRYSGANLNDFLTVENASVVSLEDVPSLDVDDIESSDVSEDSHSSESELESDPRCVSNDDSKLVTDDDSFGDSGDEDFFTVQNASSLEDLTSLKTVDSPTPNDSSAASQTEQQQEENEIEMERLPEWKTRYDDDEMDYWTSLHLACYYNWVHKVDIYVDSPPITGGADSAPDAQDPNSEDGGAAEDAEDAEDAKVSAKEEADQLPSDASPASPARKMKMLQYEYRATNINGQTEDGETPLLVACEMGHVEVVRKLLAYRDIIDVKIPDIAGRTPLSVARARAHLKGHEEVVRELLNFGSGAD